MNYYEEQSQPGKLWIRTPKGEKFPANQALSAIFSKYKPLTSSFYFDLNENNIERFDVIYDTLFIETSSGCAFEKFYVEDLLIKPYSQANLFYPFYSSKIDYWYSENSSKIYYADILDIYKGEQPYTTPSLAFVFFLAINEFDCILGSTKSRAVYKIQLGINETNSEWLRNGYTIENPKLTYNLDTQFYNVSFILRNYNNKLGLISINLKEGKRFEVVDLNAFLPYISLNKEISYIIDVVPPYLYTFIITSENGELFITSDDFYIRIE
jgi:hypothetical protein